MAELSYLATIEKKFGWEDFPFSLDLIPEVFAGKEKILNPIMEQLVIGNIVYIEGNYGSGKSQVLKHLQFKMRNDPAYKKRYSPVLIQEPVNTKILTHAFTRKFDINARIGLVNDLTDELENMLGSKKLAILLIDEAQELAITEDDTEENIEEKKKTLQWLRVLSDFRGCRIFMAGLVNFGNKINEMFRPLEDRVTLQFFLEPLDFETTVDLIKKRIRFFSEDQANPISPFSDDAYKAIYQISGGYPRAILKYCQDAVIKMLEKGKGSIDADDIYTITGEPRRVALSPSIKDVKRMEAKELETEMKSFRDQIRYDSSSLTPSELDVLRYMATKESMTPSDVADACDITSGTAANILRKLKEMGYTFRKKKGRTYSYTLYSVFRREFTQA